MVATIPAMKGRPLGVTVKTKIERPRFPAINCPHCETRAIVRSSQQMLPTYRELRLRCDNDACGHTFVADLTITRTIVPSKMPNPAIHLPRAKLAPANDDMPIAANDAAPGRSHLPGGGNVR